MSIRTILNILSIRVCFIAHLQHRRDGVAWDAVSGGVYGYYSVFEVYSSGLIG